MECTLVIDLIDVKTYGMDNGADIEIDDRRLSISISAHCHCTKICTSDIPNKKRG